MRQRQLHNRTNNRDNHPQRLRSFQLKVRTLQKIFIHDNVRFAERQVFEIFAHIMKKIKIKEIFISQQKPLETKIIHKDDKNQFILQSCAGLVCLLSVRHRGA